MSEDGYTETFSEFLERKTLEYQKLGLSEEEINQKISDYQTQRDEGNDPRVRVFHKQISETELKEQKKRILDKIESEVDAINNEDEELDKLWDEHLHKILTENEKWSLDLGQKIYEWIQRKPWKKYPSKLVITLTADKHGEIFAQIDEINGESKDGNSQ
jgi:hypothetical protein